MPPELNSTGRPRTSPSPSNVATDKTPGNATLGAGCCGSLTLMLDNAQGTHAINTQDRIDTQTLINVMTGQTVWTNMTMDIVAVRAGRIQDPISGSISCTCVTSSLEARQISSCAR